MRRLLPVSISLGLAALCLTPVTGLGAPLSERISGTEQQLESSRAREGVLTTELTGLDNQISSLSGQISSLLDREATLLARLEDKRVELDRTRSELEATRERLARLKDRLAEAERALAVRLVEIYKTDEPDALTVVLEADGFGDLLERTEFLERVSEQDQDVVTRVRRLKAQVEDDVARLEDLEARIEAALTEIIARRNELASARQELSSKRTQLAGARSDRRSALTQVRQTRVNLEGNLSELEREQEQIQRELEAARQAEAQQAAPAPAPATGGGSVGAAPSAGPVREGSGGLIWPVDGALSSGFGTRWGRAHEGVDIAAPTGTPIRAAGSGSVVTAGPTGGYGNYVCIQHDGGLSTCYAHLSEIGVSQGASVSQGDVIGAVGCTGSCFGDHLHFETRQGGQAVDPMGYL
jgi:murein DD-endopeptidase MepM/ murein hydrolase activator NlpD